MCTFSNIHVQSDEIHTPLLNIFIHNRNPLFHTAQCGLQGVQEQYEEELRLEQERRESEEEVQASRAHSQAQAIEGFLSRSRRPVAKQPILDANCTVRIFIQSIKYNINTITF